MTNEEILASASATNYAALYLNRTLRLGPGADQWLDQLARLTPDERLVLESRLQRWEALKRRSQSSARVINFASHQTLQRSA